MVHQLITIADKIGPDDTVWSIFDQKLEAALYAVEVAVSVRLRNEMGHGIELIRWLEGWNLRFKQEGKNFISIVEDSVQQQCLELSHPNMGLLYISSINEIPKVLLQLRRKNTGSVKLTDLNDNVVVGKKEVELPTGSQRRSSEPLESVHVVNALSAMHPEEQSKIPRVLSVKTEETFDVVSSEVNTVTASSVELNAVTPVSSVEQIPNKFKSKSEYPPENCKLVKQGMIINISGEYLCGNCGVTRMFCKGDIVERCENRECISDSSLFTLQHDLF